MESQLKKKIIHIASLGRELALVELSAAWHIETLEARSDDRSNLIVAAIAVRHGVPEWSEETVADLVENLSAAQLTEISTALITLSELTEHDAKKPQASPEGANSGDIASL